MTIPEIARLCHNINRAVCEAFGDHSHLPWENTDQETQDSVITGVKYALYNPHATPAQQHDEWMKFKMSHGWIYGPEKDFKRRTHPNLKPYNTLPEKERTKDVLFRAAVEVCRPLLASNSNG